MSEFIQWHQDIQATRTVEALTKNNFAASYIPAREAAIEQILALIPAGATVGIGGSWTLMELGIPALLEERGHKVLNHNAPGITPENALSIRRAQLTCDVFLTGANAITLDGKIVNVDGAGNRVAAMIFGPKQVIIVAGINKIVADVAAAEQRIATFAAPVNNKRLERPNPCIKTGTCMDCQGPTRICNVTTILRKRPPLTPTQVLLIGDKLGF